MDRIDSSSEDHGPWTYPFKTEADIAFWIAIETQITRSSKSGIISSNRNGNVIQLSLMAWQVTRSQEIE